MHIKFKKAKHFIPVNHLDHRNVFKDAVGGVFMVTWTDKKNDNDSKKHSISVVSLYSAKVGYFENMCVPDKNGDVEIFNNVELILDI